MKKLYSVLFFITTILVIWSCKKDSSAPNQTNTIPAITEIGIPAGQSVTQTIGSSGGTVLSGDGIMELDIPSDALGADANITIEPITNKAPGGLGNGYRFGPSGTIFSKPVVLKFHYTDQDVIGTSPHFMGIAFQDTNKVWYSLRNFTYDTINKTIITETKHFTDYATFIDLTLVPVTGKVKINENLVLKVMVLDNPGDGDELTALTPPKAGEDELASLPKQHEVNDGLVKNWAANGIVGGSTQYGIITPQGAHCSFKAPATKPSGSKNPVQISAQINMRYKDPKTKIDYGDLKLNSSVEITDDNYSYHLEVDYNDPNYEDAYATWTVTDIAQMDIEIKDDIAVITNYENEDGKVTPASQKIDLGMDPCTVKWISENFAGPLTITEVTGFASSMTGVPGDTKTLIFQLKIDKRITPKFSTVCNSGNSYETGGDDLGLDYYGADFLLRDSDQTFHDQVTTQLSYKLTAK